jgi:2'-5' RNA ligase
VTNALSADHDPQIVTSPERATELPTSSLEKPTESWRVFVAIELPTNLRIRIIDHIDRLRSEIPEVRASWSREDNLHLTLKFLGDILVTNIDQLAAAASLAASKVDPFEIVIEGCGVFPLRGQPRVLWIGIDDPSGKLCELNRALENECANAGFAREARVFHPHLTIARIRQPQGSRQLAAAHKEIGFAREVTVVSALAVIRSELRSEGSKHTIISRHAFSPSMK